MANKNTRQARRAGFASKDDENRGNKNPYAKGKGRGPRFSAVKRYPSISAEDRAKSGM